MIGSDGTDRECPICSATLGRTPHCPACDQHNGVELIPADPVGTDRELRAALAHAVYYKGPEWVGMRSSDLVPLLVALWELIYADRARIAAVLRSAVAEEIAAAIETEKTKPMMSGDDIRNAAAIARRLAVPPEETE